MSVKLLEDCVDKNGIELENEDVRFIGDLIQGKPSVHDEKRWIFDIVANARNSVDVDKFDYLQRDCYNVGMKVRIVNDFPFLWWLNA